MSDPSPAPGPSPYASPFVAILATGLASSLLYVSIFLSFAFLLPVQVAYGRFGRNQGLAAAGISAAGISAVQLWRLAQGNALGAVGIASAILPPLVLLAAIVLLNEPFGADWEPTYKLFGATALCALAALPIILSLGKDQTIASFLEERISELLAPLSAGAGEGYEASALAASMDPKEIVASSMLVLRDSFAAILFLLIGGSRRLGDRLSGRYGIGRARTAAIEALRLPYPLLWAFLGSWSLVLAAEALHAPVAAGATAWNLALVASLAYAAPGLGIVVHLFKRWNVPKSVRALLAVTAVIALATPLGIAVAIALPLFGVTETWIPYRKPKGVGA